MRSTKVNIYDQQKVFKLPTGLRLLIRKACHATLEYEQFEGVGEVDVSIVDDQKIQEMNREYRKLDRSTDVLSFPLGKDGKYDLDPETGAYCLGDIVISIEHAVAQAECYGHSLQREVAFLTVHSMLHLLGYDHETSRLDEMRMKEKQEAILDRLGLSIVKH